MKRIPEGQPAPKTAGASPESSDTCIHKKGQNLRMGQEDVDALIKALEARGSAARAPEAAEAHPPAAAEPLSLGQESEATGFGKRMSDEDLEELSLVLKMTRSATNARQCGLRLLEETQRAREAEARLLKEAAPAARTVRRFPAA